MLLTPLNQKLISDVDTAKPALAADTAVPDLMATLKMLSQTNWNLNKTERCLFAITLEGKWN